MPADQLKVLFSFGQVYNRRAKHLRGYLTFSSDRIIIRGDCAVEIPFSKIRAASEEFIQMRGSVIKLTLDQENMYISGLRFMFFNHFALLNYFGTKSLYKRIKEKVHAPLPGQN